MKKEEDACPVTRIAEDIARKYGIPVTLLCDTNHRLTSDYSTVRVIGAGADAVDMLSLWMQYILQLQFHTSMSNANFFSSL